jgi:hypothetical protein
MKNVIRLLFAAVICMFIFNSETQAQMVSRTEALNAAENYITQRHLDLSIAKSEPLISEIDSIARVFRCAPQGYIVISSSQLLPPVLAWSEEGNFGEGIAWESFLPIFQYDLKTRLEFTNPESAESKINRQKWASLAGQDRIPGDFQQWPPVGWSSTGGWLFTNWTQSAPYNALCPIDGQTQVRSYAGCPATAMAQILNFQHNIHQTRFSNTDDYYHNFGSGNSYWIDNDWENHGFPSWDQLNVYLDTLEVHYQQGVTLTNTDKAALTYACGAAAKQVYSSSGSGTFGVDQAYDAYIRFGYSDARLEGPSNPDLNTQLAQNIILALPAHLALVNPAWTVGHNVVVDGYNTDELFHFNFGWGGSANGWYTMPPTDIPYDLTVIEGVVIDINLSSPPVGLAEEINPDETIKMIYIANENKLRIFTSGKLPLAELFIYDNTGKIIRHEKPVFTDRSESFELALPYLASGLYIARLVVGNRNASICKFIR